MSDIFFSYVEEDAALVAQLAAGLEDAGYTTWYFERDSIAGIPYVRQIPDVIDAAQAVVIVISPVALKSPHVDREVVEAYRGGKQLIPLLHGLTHSEFRAQRRDWALMLGAAVSVTVPVAGIAATVPRIVAGLRQMGVVPSGVIRSTPEPPPAPPPVPETEPVRISKPDSVSSQTSATEPEPGVVPAPEPARVPEGRASAAPTTTFDRERWQTPPVGYSPGREAPTAGAPTPESKRHQSVLRRFWGSSNRRRFIAFIAAIVAVGVLTGLGFWFFAGNDGDDNHTPTSIAATQPPLGTFSDWKEEWLGGDKPVTRIDEQGQQLTITIPPEPDNSDEDSNFGGIYGPRFGVGRVSPSPLVGDFCIEVRYHLKVWPSGNGVRIGLVTNANGEQSVERKSRSEKEKMIDKSANPGSPDYTEGWFVTGPGLSEVVGGEEGEFGNLRLERIGSEMTAYVRTSQSDWEPPTSLGRGWIGDTKVSLRGWSHKDIFEANETVEVVFDNFTAECEPLTGIQTATTGPAIDDATDAPQQQPTPTEEPPTNTPEQSPTVTPTVTPRPEGPGSLTPTIPNGEHYLPPEDQEVKGT